MPEVTPAIPPERIWIEKLRSASDETKLKAAEELARVGSAAAIRPLLDAIRATGPSKGPIGPVEAACGLAVRAIFAKDPDGVVEGFRAAFGDSNPAVRRTACEAAGWWIGLRAGERAEAFGRELIQLYEKDPDREVRRASIVAIWRIRVPGTPTILAKAIKDADPEVRSAAANAFYWLDREALPPIDTLLEVIRNDDWLFSMSEQRPAATALGRIGAPALPGLVKICGEGEIWVQWAAYAIGEMGPAAAPAVPVLIKLLKDHSLDLLEQREVVRALGRIGASALPAVPDLEVFTLDAERDWLENVAFDAMSRIVRDALERSGSLEEGKGAEGLLGLLAAGARYERWGAAELLGDGGRHPVGLIVARLCEVLEDRTEDLFVRRSAAVSLGRLQMAASGAVPSLARVLRDRYVHVFVRRAAAEALGRVDGAGAALGELLGVFADRTDDFDLRWTAIRSVQAMGHKALSILPTLLSLLADRSYECTERREVLLAIGEIGPDAAQVVPKFVALIGDTSEDEVLRWGAAEALPSLGPTGIEGVLRLLSHEHPKVRRMALFALRGYGDAARDAVGAVEPLLSDPDPDVREQACRALAEIRDAPKPHLREDKP